MEQTNPTFSRRIAPPDQGLTAAEVNERYARGLANTPVSSPTKSVRQIILSNVLTYFNCIFFVLAAALIAVGSFHNLTFLFVVVVNTVIGIVQELNAKKTLDKLTLLSQPHATVVREGQTFPVETAALVLDDIVCFSAGNQICADAVVVDGEVQVNESLITGEADEIVKRADDELLSGSFVISGSCRARLTRVGAESFVSRLTLEAKKHKKKQAPGMMRSLTRLVQVIGIAIIPMGVAILLRQLLLLELPIRENVEKTTAALIGMIPEGLYLLANVALAVSVVKLAKQRTLVHDLTCIETLARVDVLCVDKTGTITEPTMKVDELISLSPDYAEPRLTALMADFVGNMSVDNATMKALSERFKKASYRRAKQTKPFSSTTKTSSVSFGESETYLLGAPEFLLREGYEVWREHVEPHAQKGARVLMLALLDHDGILTPLALVLLSNRLRINAKETFSYFVEQGVAIKVISGDNPLTVSAAAAAAGIPNADCAIDLSAIKSDEELAHAAEEYTVFGRVTPDQKRRLVQHLKAAKHTVAMTGDGVNDVLALKEADCSVAMASGSDVACQVSHLVLLDSDFSAMPAVVREGRQVINNLERSASLFLVKNIFSFVLSLISIFAVFAYPLTPSQISLISMVTIGIPAFCLALEKNENRVRGKFLRNVIFRALPAAVTDLFVIGGVLLFVSAFSLTDATATTIATLLMSFVGFAMIVRISLPFNKLRAALLAALVVIFFAAILLMPKFFTLSALHLRGWLLLVVFTLLIPSVFFAANYALNFTAKKYREIRAKLRDE